MLGGARLESDEPGRAQRTFVVSFLAVIVIVAFAGFEAWPFTAFRLFSAARGTERTSYEAVTVDAHGVETPLRQESLAFGYRLAEWPMAELADDSQATRIAVCDGLADGARSVERDVANVLVLKVRERLRRVDGAWQIERAPAVLVDCRAEGWQP